MKHKFKLFDSHLHIIDNRFPLVTNQGYVPDVFTHKDYLRIMKEYNLCGGVIVSGSFQAFDQSYLVDALRQLGPSFVGVLQLPATVSDEELINLSEIGVRAVRFNLKRGGSEEIHHLENMAKRIYEIVGWHVELYLDSKALTDLYQIIIALPAVSIDHLGLSKEGLNILVSLAEYGVRVKATGFGRVDFDVRRALHDIYLANPKSLMFGTDLPSTRAPRLYKYDDFNLVIESLGEDKARAVLFENAIEFYKPKNTNYQPALF